MRSSIPGLPFVAGRPLSLLPWHVLLSFSISILFTIQNHSSEESDQKWGGRAAHVGITADLGLDPGNGGRQIHIALEVAIGETACSDRNEISKMSLRVQKSSSPSVDRRHCLASPVHS
jgi:hypothetical protein